MTTIHRAPVALLVLAAAWAVVAQPDRTALKPVPLEQLKVVYLDCDALATATALPVGIAGHCSMVAEELLQRGFGGDFGRLLSWWRENRLSNKCLNTAQPASTQCDHR